MTAPTFHLARTPASPGSGVTLALTQDISPDNPVVGDLDLAGGQLHLWDAREGRRQKIRMVLQFGLGEFWLNPDEGIPYFPNVIGTKQKGAVTSIFRKAFLRALPDLAQIISLSLVFDATRAATIAFELRFDDGMIISSDEFSSLELGI
jgi:hypothetical protein